MTTLATNRRIEIQAFSGSRVAVEIDIPEPLEVVCDGDEVNSEQRGVFRIMTPQDGDKRIVWDKFSLPDINAAKEMFTGLIKQGLKPFKVGTNGQATSEVMDEFDPHAEEVIFLPMAAVVGG